MINRDDPIFQYRVLNAVSLGASISLNVSLNLPSKWDVLNY